MLLSSRSQRIHKELESCELPHIENYNVEFGHARSYPEAEWQNKEQDLMQSQENPASVETPICKKINNNQNNTTKNPPTGKPLTE